MVADASLRSPAQRGGLVATAPAAQLVTVDPVDQLMDALGRDGLKALRQLWADVGVSSTLFAGLEDDIGQAVVAVGEHQVFRGRAPAFQLVEEAVRVAHGSHPSAVGTRLFSQCRERLEPLVELPTSLR